MKASKEYTPTEIQKIAQGYNIENDELYILQNTYNEYFDRIGIIYGYKSDICDTSQILKHHYQPLQVLFFDQTGKLVSFHNNCHTGGFPNLKWNRNSVFDSLPAKPLVPLDTLLNLNSLIDFLLAADGSNLDSQLFKNNEYTIAVFWTTFMGRQSKRLIRIIQEKYTHEPNVEVLYIEADCIFSSPE